MQPRPACVELLMLQFGFGNKKKTYIHKCVIRKEYVCIPPVDMQSNVSVLAAVPQFPFHTRIAFCEVFNRISRTRSLRLHLSADSSTARALVSRSEVDPNNHFLFAAIARLLEGLQRGKSITKIVWHVGTEYVIIYRHPWKAIAVPKPVWLNSLLFNFFFQVHTSFFGYFHINRKSTMTLL